MPLPQWDDISKDFKNGSIILGNGSSIAINPSFNYKNLYKNALQKEHIDQKVKQIFDHLKTKDFELVLRMLWHTNTINKVLDIEDNDTTIAYKNVRKALIQSVKDNHPDYQDEEKIKFDSKLTKIGIFLNSFKTVISLNYDLIVYWAIMKFNDVKENKRKFKDCWNKRDKYTDWEPLRFNSNLKEFREHSNATLVFYPHGNLILTTDLYGQEEKITANKTTNNLIEEIIKRWETEDYLPLFVSEGTSEQKKKAIGRSYYLETVYNEMLKDSQENKNIVIFGWSMSEHDAHILDAIEQAKPERIAISIHVPNEDTEEKIEEKIEEKCKIYKKIIKTDKHKHLSSIDDRNIHFFDSSSDDFWIKKEIKNEQKINKEIKN